MQRINSQWKIDIRVIDCINILMIFKPNHNLHSICVFQRLCHFRLDTTPCSGEVCLWLGFDTTLNNQLNLVIGMSKGVLGLRLSPSSLKIAAIFS